MDCKPIKNVVSKEISQLIAKNYKTCNLTRSIHIKEKIEKVESDVDNLFDDIWKNITENPFLFAGVIVAVLVFVYLVFKCCFKKFELKFSLC